MKVDQLFFRLIDRGGETVAANLASGLAERGHDVSNLGFFRDLDGPAPVTADWQVLAPETGSAKEATPKALWRWWKRLRSRRPDVVVAHTQVAALLGLPLAAVCGVGRRISVDHQPQGQELGLPFQLADKLMGTLGVYTDVVLVSQVNLDRLSTYPERYRRRVSLLANEIPPPRLPAREQAREQLGLAQDALVCCFLGEISESKGAVVAATAVAASPDVAATSDVVLLMAGRPGNASEQVAALADDSDGRVRTIGHVRRPEVEQILAASDVLLFPSYAENRSLTLLESLSAGLAVVAGDVPANRYVLEDGDALAGLLLDTGDQPAWNAVVEELRDPARLKELRERALARGSEWERMLDGYEAAMAGTGVPGTAFTS